MEIMSIKPSWRGESEHEGRSPPLSPRHQNSSEPLLHIQKFYASVNSLPVFLPRASFPAQGESHTRFAYVSSNQQSYPWRAVQIGALLMSLSGISSLPAFNLPACLMSIRLIPHHSPPKANFPREQQASPRPFGVNPVQSNPSTLSPSHCHFLPNDQAALVSGSEKPV